MKNKKPIYVTQPFLPPIVRFIPYLMKIWRNKILTNGGPLHRELERKLCEYLGVEYISLFSNGTLALMAALNVSDIKGEVITTPYTFVATTHSLLWNNNKPVFVDIDPNTFNLDPKKIEVAITPNTTAIMPVHVYGVPCDVKKIEEIAKRYNLKVIYDACHAFGVKIGEESIFKYGDLSVVSFHATKVFNTFEGGAVICHSKEIKEKLDNFKNFGIRSDITDRTFVDVIGLNAKMNEIQAAMGLLQLKYVEKNILKRKKIFDLYRKMLFNIEGIGYIKDISGVKHNYSYFPILVNRDKYGKSRDDIFKKLAEHNIFGRPYFSPLIKDFVFYDNMDLSDFDISTADYISKNIICLPIYPKLKSRYIKNIVNIIKNEKN